MNFDKINERFVNYIDVIGKILISFFPRNKKLIIYTGALDLFIDNAKHSFIYNNEQLPSYRHVWLTRKESIKNRLIELGFEAYDMSSYMGIWMHLRAGFVIFDNAVLDYQYPKLTTGADRIQLWHGLPLKMWAYATKDNQPAYVQKSEMRYICGSTRTHGDFCLVTSRNLYQVFSASFNIPMNKLFLGTYPRTLVELMSEKDRKEYIKKYETKEVLLQYEEILKLKYRKVIYMPTFRDANKYYINEAIPDWERLNTYCAANNIMLFLKVHRETPTPIGNYNNIRIIPNDIDIYPILPLFDLLITDYSSIMYDYALMNKPVALYLFDLESYVANSRKVYKKFLELKDNLTVAHDFEGFLKCLDLPKSKYRVFPISEYYESPYNYNAVIEFIKNRSNK